MDRRILHCGWDQRHHRSIRVLSVSMHEPLLNLSCCLASTFRSSRIIAPYPNLASRSDGRVSRRRYYWLMGPNSSTNAMIIFVPFARPWLMRICRLSVAPSPARGIRITGRAVSRARRSIEWTITNMAIFIPIRFASPMDRKRAARRTNGKTMC